MRESIQFIFIFKIIGLNQEIKEMKKRAEMLEEELGQSKKNFSKEMSELTQYYEQRVR